MRLLTAARDLRRRRAREREGLFVVEGVRACEELAGSALGVVGVLAAPGAEASPRGAALLARFAATGIPVEGVSDREFQSAAETDAPQGVLAVARVPAVSLDALPRPVRRLLVLDAVQDPGNVGTLVRTAAALDVDATVALPGTVDLWNAKVVRGAMGAHFRHPACHLPWEALHATCRAHGLRLWGADVDGAEVGTLPRPEACALVVGNEGSGLSPAVRAALDQVVSLRINPAVESLNVAVAAGILLHALRP